DTTGVLGLSGPPGRERARAFTSWATIPSYYDLGTARVIHFFFAWVPGLTLLAWPIASLANGHIRRDLLPRPSDLSRLPGDLRGHLRLRFHHNRNYNTLQKLSYGCVLFILLPAMVVTGLAMSPSMNSAFPWLNEALGGRQTARTIHFAVMTLLVLFFVIHLAMILAAGPINELRSIVTGWYRTDPPGGDGGERSIRHGRIQTHPPEIPDGCLCGDVGPAALRLRCLRRPSSGGKRSAQLSRRRK